MSLVGDIQPDDVVLLSGSGVYEDGREWFIVGDAEATPLGASLPSLLKMLRTRVARRN